MATYEELEGWAWSGVDFKSGQPLLPEELNLLQEVLDFKRRKGLESIATYGFLTNTQNFDPLDDYTVLNNLITLNSRLLFFQGDFYKIPNLIFDFTNETNPRKLIYLEINPELSFSPSVSTDKVRQYGYSSGLVDVDPKTYITSVGVKTAGRKQFQYTHKVIDYSYNNLEGIPGYTYTQGKGWISTASPTTYAVPLALVFSKTSSNKFSPYNLSSKTDNPYYNSNIDKEHILDLREFITPRDFSFEAELSLQIDLLFKNSLKTWAMSSTEMGSEPETVGQNLFSDDISTTPLVNNSIKLDGVRESISERPFTFQILPSTAVTTTVGAIYKSGLDLIINTQKYNIDYYILSSSNPIASVSINSSNEFKITNFFSSVPSTSTNKTINQVYISPKEGYDFRHPPLGDIYYFDSSGTPKPLTKTGSKYGVLTPDKNIVVYKTAAPQTLCSGWNSGKTLNLTVSTLYVPDYCYLTAISRFSLNQSTDFLYPSDQIPLLNDEIKLNGSGGLYFPQFSSDVGFFKLPLARIKASNSFTLEFNANNVEVTRKAALLKKTSGDLTLYTDPCNVGVDRKIFMFLLVKAETVTGSNQVVQPGDVLVMVASKFISSSELENDLTNPTSFGLYKPRGLWNLPL